MKLLPTSDQITDDLNDLKLRIAKINARRNAQIDLLQRKILGRSLRNKHDTWSPEYYRRLYNTYSNLYPFNSYRWRSPSFDSLKLDKYYDSFNHDDKTYIYKPDDQLYSKYKRIAKTYPPNTDLLSKLKDFVFEQDRQMTTELLRKITENRNMHSTSQPNLYSRESKSSSHLYGTNQKNYPPFLNPINKKDNFYRRYNAFIKKIMKPMRKSSPKKYEPSKTTDISKTTSPNPDKINYFPKSYLDDYHYLQQFHKPYWYRYSSYPYNRRYLYNYDYVPKLQPASVPLDVESIIRKLNSKHQNYKPVKKSYLSPTIAYKYDPFESDSYLRSSLPTWKQYYYTQKLKSKPSNECFLDYYDPYYDFFSDRASLDSTDDLLSSEETPLQLSDDANQLVDEYRDAIYEDIIQNLRHKQSKRKDTALRTDRKLFGYRVNDRAELPRSYFTSEHLSYLHRPTYASSVYGMAECYPRKFSHSYHPQDNTSNETVYSNHNFEQNYETNYSKDVNKSFETPHVTADNERSNFSLQENYYKIKLEDDAKILPTDTRTRQNVISPSIFHSKCITPVENSFNKYLVGNSHSMTKSTNCNAEGKQSPRNTSEEKKVEKYRSNNTLNKIKPSSSYDENKHKYDFEPKKFREFRPNSLFIDEYPADTSTDQYKTDNSPVSEYKRDNSLTPFVSSKIGNSSNDYQSSPTSLQFSDKFTPINSSTKLQFSAEPCRLNYTSENEASTDKFTPINFSTKRRPSVELRRPSNNRSENEIKVSSNPVPQNEKIQQNNSLTVSLNESSLPNESVPERRFRRQSSTSSIGVENRELPNADSNKYSSEPTQKHPNSPIVRKQTRLSASETGLGVETRFTEPRRGSSDAAPENLRRSSSTRSRQSTPSERSTLSRRNSIVFDGNKSFTSQTASRKNSIKPLQRRNSIQPVSEKRNLLQKMNHEIKYDGDDQSPFSNENSAESYSIEEQAEVNEDVPYRSLNEFQKKMSKGDVFSSVDELAQKNMDSAKHNTYIDVSKDYPVDRYDLNLNEEQEARDQKTSAPLPETNYHDENPSSYEENSKNSYEKDFYNRKDEQKFPEDNYAEEMNLNPQGLVPEQTYQRDSNYSSLDGYQKNYNQGENYPNDYSGYYNQSQAASLNDVLDEYMNFQDRPQQRKSGLFDSYSDQEHPSLASQNSNDSHSRRSFQLSKENTDGGLSISQSPVRSYEPKEQEQSLNSINEETEKLDDKSTENKRIKNVQQTPAENIANTTSVKSKRSVDLGKSSAPPKELSRRASRNTLLSQSSDDKKFKNQSSAGELQKRMSKPIGEGKLRRTASTVKVKPTGVTKKA